MNILSRGTPRGFTIVELIVVIAVMGILAGITVVGYNGWRERASRDAVLSDIAQASNAMKSQLNFTNSYPATLADLRKHFNGSDEVQMTLYSSSRNNIHYDNLSSIQNGELFYEVCREIISENRPAPNQAYLYGQGRDQGGTTHSFLSGPLCHVYGPGEIRLNNGWSQARPSSGGFTTPIEANTLSNFYTNLSYNEPWFPTFKEVVSEFYREWDERFIAYGGTYPITSFWNPDYGCNAYTCWNTPGYEPLPEPVSNENFRTHGYCIEARHSRFSTLIYHRRHTDSATQSGSC